MTLQNYLTYFDEMISPAESLFRLVPLEKLDWKPSDKSFTTGQLMAHMTGALAVQARGIARGDWGFASWREIFVFNRGTPPLGVEKAIEALHENSAVFKHLVGGLTEEEFDHGEIDSPQLGRVPRWRAAMLAVEHFLNHKAELFMYLKFMGVKVHTGHLYSRR